jgi:hypothetical protein
LNEIGRIIVEGVFLVHILAEECRRGQFLLFDILAEEEEKAEG